mmetsp:Transcript_10205/g.19960  ORF Transcript_10205/g.19960 Transcript_10205/m.19960 type:complete len:88 (+) Transcript_10205:492-755(+)
MSAAPPDFDTDSTLEESKDLVDIPGSEELSHRETEGRRKYKPRSKTEAPSLHSHTAPTLSASSLNMKEGQEAEGKPRRVDATSMFFD